MARNVRCEVRLTEDDEKRIEANMEELGMTNRSQYIRKMAVEGMIVQLDLSDIKELLRLLAIYGNNLNQYARKANEGCGVYQDDVKQVQEEHKEMMEMMRTVVARLSSIG